MGREDDQRGDARQMEEGTPRIGHLNMNGKDEETGFCFVNDFSMCCVAVVVVTFSNFVLLSTYTR